MAFPQFTPRAMLAPVPVVSLLVFPRLIESLDTIRPLKSIYAIILTLLDHVGSSVGALENLEPFLAWLPTANEELRATRYDMLNISPIHNALPHAMLSALFLDTVDAPEVASPRLHLSVAAGAPFRTVVVLPAGAHGAFAALCLLPAAGFLPAAHQLALAVCRSLGTFLLIFVSLLVVLSIERASTAALVVYLPIVAVTLLHQRALGPARNRPLRAGGVLVAAFVETRLGP